MRVLLADDNQERAGAVARSLAEAGGVEILRLEPGVRLLDAVREQKPDVLIVDMSRPDRDSLDGIRAVSAQDPRPIVMFVDRDDRAFMEEAIAAGVSSYNLLGNAVPDVKPIVRAAVAIFQRYQQVANDLDRARSRIDQQETIKRAKAILMKRRRLDEPAAHRWLRRTAMNRGRRIVDIALEIVESADKDGK